MMDLRGAQTAIYPLIPLFAAHESVVRILNYLQSGAKRLLNLTDEEIAKSDIENTYLYEFLNSGSVVLRWDAKTNTTAIPLHRCTLESLQKTFDTFLSTKKRQSESITSWHNLLVLHAMHVSVNYSVNMSLNGDEARTDWIIGVKLKKKKKPSTKKTPVAIVSPPLLVNPSSMLVDEKTSEDTINIWAKKTRNNVFKFLKEHAGEIQLNIVAVPSFVLLIKLPVTKKPFMTRCTARSPDIDTLVESINRASINVFDLEYYMNNLASCYTRIFKDTGKLTLEVLAQRTITDNQLHELLRASPLSKGDSLVIVVHPDRPEMHEINVTVPEMGTGVYKTKSNSKKESIKQMSATTHSDLDSYIMQLYRAVFDPV